MICPKCGNVITHNSYFDAYYCPRCGEFIREKPPMTNADRIRAMSDDELAEFLADAAADYCHVGLFKDGETCRICCLRWLQMTEEEDHA